MFKSWEVQHISRNVNNTQIYSLPNNYYMSSHVTPYLDQETELAASQKNVSFPTRCSHLAPGGTTILTFVTITCLPFRVWLPWFSSLNNIFCLKVRYSIWESYFMYYFVFCLLSSAFEASHMVCVTLHIYCSLVLLSFVFTLTYHDVALHSVLILI